MKISKTKLQSLARLKQKKQRDAEGLFCAEGAKCVVDTLGHFDLYYLVATPRWLSENPRSKALEASPAEMARLSGLSTPADVIAYYRKPELDRAEWESGICSRLTLLLDGVQDPGNLGTIIRVADWFGVRHIAASHDTADLFNAKTVQATMGAISRVSMLYTDLGALVGKYPQLRVFGTLLEGENIYSQPLAANGFIVMGNEGKGISADLRRLVTDPLLIPSYPPGEPTSESLNVSMATGITLSEFRRRQF